MIISKEVYISWNAKNKKYYRSLGYVFTKMNDKFLVKIKDLTSNSCAIITLKCDYCGEIYNVKYYTYNNRKDKTKDCCGNPDCTKQKSLDVIYKKYGVDNCRHISGVSEKIKKTCMLKYGVENPFSDKKIKEKIKKTNIQKYGTEKASSNPIISNKISKSMISYWMNNEDKKKIGERSPHWKGGVEYSRVERATHEYQEWRKSVFIRDKFVCQKCKEHTNNLNAHHISNWKSDINHRYDINNGITLCKDCHKKFHSIYGIKNNSIEQLLSFLHE